MFKNLFTKSTKFDGIRPINIYFMRLIYVLMFFVLGKDVWGYILSYSGVWEENDAVAWSVWAAFSALALLGIFRTVEMIPILLLEIFLGLKYEVQHLPGGNVLRWERTTDT